MTAITGTITATEGSGTIPAPTGPFTPKVSKIVAEGVLLAQHYEDASGSGENWYNNWDFKYSDFTTYLPKAGDTLTFQLRGTIDKQLDWFQLVLSSYKKETDTYKWYADSSWTDAGNNWAKIPLSFDQTLEITINTEHPAYKYGAPTKEDYPYMDLAFINFLWGKGADGEYWHNSGSTLPEGAKNFETVMAIFRNLEVRFVGITRKTP